MKALELAGQRFGRWTVLRRAPYAPGGARWCVRCDCGTERVLVATELVRGRTVSCGCYRRDRLTKEVPGYDAVHLRVRKARGKATRHVCVDCSAPAAEWSYDRSDPDELTETRHGYVIPYSLDPDRYVPRCLSCHRTLDRHKESA